MSDRLSRMVLFLVAEVFLLTGLAILPVPFTRDQGIYSYIAWRWMAGDIPYLDTFGHKGPLLYAIYAAALKFSGGAMWGPNLFDLLARTATIILVFSLARIYLRPRLAVYASLFTALPLMGVFNSCWWNAQAETFMMPFLVLSALLVFGDKDKWKTARLVLAGAVAAQAIMLKPTSMLHAIFLMAWVLWRERGKGSTFPRLIVPPVYVGGGVAAGLAPWLIYFGMNGALGSMYELLFAFNSAHFRAAVAGLGERTFSLFIRGQWNVFYVVPLFLLMLLLPSSRTFPREKYVFILAWAAVSLLQVLLQARFFLYHWLVLVPAMGLAAGAGMSSLYYFLSSKKYGWVGRVVPAIIFLWLALWFGRSWALIEESYQTREYVQKKISRAEYYSRFSEVKQGGVGDFNLLASVAAAEYIRLNAEETGYVLVFGYEPIVNYLSARPSPSRFQIDYPLTFAPRDDKAKVFRSLFRRRFFDDLRVNPPEMIVLVDNDQNAIEPKTSIESAQEFRSFWTWLNQNYREIDRIEDFHFYVPKVTRFTFPEG